MIQWCSKIKLTEALLKNNLNASLCWEAVF